ncbi:MAG: hotdog domain-containing protein [Planctomycetota bacterium]
MKSSLQVGNTATHEITVTEEMCPAFDEIIVHRVYSTWSMAHHMEIAARMVLAPHLDDHEEGIGSHLSIDHVGPTPVGHTVRLVAEAMKVERSTLVCDVTAYHVRDAGDRVVGRGTQVQRVLPKSKLQSLIERSAT